MSEELRHTDEGAFLDAPSAIDPEGPAGYVLYRDGLFRKKKKRGWRIVESPNPLLEGAVADTHAHLHMLADVPLSLARCAVQGIDFVCTITDPSEDDAAPYRSLDAWRSEALRVLPDVFSATRVSLDAARESGAADGGEFPSDEALSFRCPCDVGIPHVRIASGVHPHNASAWTDELEQVLRAQLADPRTCALGEVGLDYHYDLSPRDVQKDVFRRQVRLAHETGLPLILHMRDAHDDGFAILEEEGWPEAGVLLHCCSVGPEELQRWLDKGCYVAFGGAVTFSRSDDLRASATLVPADRLLTETDSPYMAPVPFRGIECAPEFTAYVAEYVAGVREAVPGESRAGLLRTMHDAALGLLDRGLTPWQVVNAHLAENAFGGDAL